jgi:hypothetical protein
MFLQTHGKARQVEPPSSVLHKLEILGTDRTGSISAVVLQELAEDEKPVLPEQIAVLAIRAGFVASRSKQRLPYDAKVETARVKSDLGIIPERLFTNQLGSDEPCSLSNREIVVGIDHISDGRTMRCFANGNFHPQIQQHSQTHFNLDVRRWTYGSTKPKDTASRGRRYHAGLGYRERTTIEFLRSSA